MKKILGLDLGTTSIGWALVEETENKSNIVDLGVRIIPLSTDEKSEFSAGNAISKNQDRTTKRTQRKGYDRYQLRRTFLTKFLNDLAILPGEEYFKLNAIELYGLRNKAVSEKITLQELGRIFLHLNQKRGYKSSLKEENAANKKEGEYVAAVKGRFNIINDRGITVGQYFYEGLQSDIHYRIKEQIFPREAYINEFDVIWNNQKQYHKEQLTDDNFNKVRNEIIFYQRPLKSQKGLVSICEFEGKFRKNKEGKPVFVGPKVAPRSSPLFQISKIWESINIIKLKGKRGQEYEITLAQKNELFNYLDNNEKLSEAELFKILKLNKEDGYAGNSMTKNGIKGNETKAAINKIIKGLPNAKNLLKFELTENTKYVDFKTGEETERLMIDASFEKEPLYQLWHCIYSISNDNDLIKALVSKFNIPDEEAKQLAKLDFTKQGFSGKSAKVIRKTLPFLQSGFMYNYAMEYAGFNHSNSLSKAENEARTLLEKLPQLQKNSLRQPVVEKILNQMINVVNAIITTYGKPDEIRVELARELKSSKDERNTADKNNRAREIDNKKIAERLENDYGVKANKRNIDKYKMYMELDGISLYTGKRVELAAFLRGNQVDVEHILPKSRIFDDSLQNKTICEQQENRNKGNMTAYDYMQTKSKSEFSDYIERVEGLFKLRKISKAKRDKLLTPAAKIPDDFIERQLRQTQYIAKKSTELLKDVCYNVWATSGQVTDYLRHQWGWDEVLMNLKIEMYKSKGYTNLIESYEVQENGQVKTKERIKGWTKRDDHRHHAIDALTIACTKQGIIQRLNKLNQEVIKREGETKTDALKAETSLKDYIIAQKPFTTKQVEDKAANILISFKAGKKAASTGTRKVKINGKKQVVQKNIIIPRGALSEESIYGKIKTIEKNVPLNKLFENPDNIVKHRIKILIYDRLNENNGDVKKAIASIKKLPIILDEAAQMPLTYASVYKEEFVIKYNVNSIQQKDLIFVVDEKVKEILAERLAAFNNNSKEAFKDLEANPVWFNKEKGIKIKTVRLKTGLGNLVPLHASSNGNTHGISKESTQLIDYVKPGNNHHLSIFEDENGKYHDLMTTFWEAVERKKQGLPIIRTEHPSGFKFVMSLQQNELVSYNTEENINEPISNKLYRVQKISKNTIGAVNIMFRHHLETQLIDDNIAKTTKRFINTQSLDSLKQFSKNKTTILGHLV
jgi:CRISPR-associated endonuclease Csn1